ncbi:type II toxin-antitoxin system VapC family toxin [Phaeodactylibacter xiamenensis]|jgi:tRNA(fMet)-specific endonuclease VapC|uniref:type II toxin-antitoxin system VapC family toxin n=1 Tax=Phaeodactylibacter xiamenensis TaxID=1524460 RepID=UPI0024A88B49|nr:type II toxin-antitoxin system VapC family toxin [Phaeodactylibacter xiamenensis]
MEESILDTDTLSYFLKGDETVAKKVIQYLEEYEKLLISIITYYEIRSGLEYKEANKQLLKFKAFVDENCEVINLTEKSVEISSFEYGELRRNGETIGTSDLLIAGIAIEKGLTLITNNMKHYIPINKLKVSNWKG